MKIRILKGDRKHSQTKADSVTSENDCKSSDVYLATKKSLIYITTFQVKKTFTVVVATPALK